MADPQNPKSFPSSQRYGINMREPKPLKKTKNSSAGKRPSNLQWLHDTLQWGGLLPFGVTEAFDLIDAGIYTLEGNLPEAGMSLAAVVPGASVITQGKRSADRLQKASDAGKKLASETTELAKKAAQAEKAGNIAKADKLAKQARDKATKGKAKVDAEFKTAQKKFDDVFTPASKERKGLEPADLGPTQRNIVRDKELELTGSPNRRITGASGRQLKREAKKQTQDLEKGRTSSILQKRAADRDVSAAGRSAGKTLAETGTRARVDFGKAFDDIPRNARQGELLSPNSFGKGGGLGRGLSRFGGDMRRAVTDKPFTTAQRAIVENPKTAGVLAATAVGTKLARDPVETPSEAKTAIDEFQQRRDRDAMLLKSRESNKAPASTASTSSPAQGAAQGAAQYTRSGGGGGLIMPEGQKLMEKYSGGVAPKQTPTQTPKPPKGSSDEGKTPKAIDVINSIRGKGGDKQKPSSGLPGRGLSYLRTPDEVRARIAEGQKSLSQDPTSMVFRNPETKARFQAGVPINDRFARLRAQNYPDEPVPQMSSPQPRKNPYMVGPAPSAEGFEDTPENRQRIKDLGYGDLLEDEERKKGRARRRTALDMLRGRKRGV
jgi:hypothetical protein